MDVVNKESADIEFGSAGELRAFVRNVGGVPNEKTIEAINEVQRMKNGVSGGKVYSDVDAMIEELLR